jgi:ribonuclease Z
MEVIILGSGSPLVVPDRAGPSTLVRIGKTDLLFDCGRAVLMRGAAVGMTARDLSALFVTHMHSDHTTDYNDIITTRWISSPQSNPLVAYGPAGFKRFTDATLTMLDTDVHYRMSHHADLQHAPQVQAHEVSEGLVFEAPGIRVTAAATDHSPVHPTMGFRIEAEGKSVVIAGDTVPCEGLSRLCQGADVYVQTVIRRPFIEKSPMQRFRDVLDYHSDISQAAQTAQASGVRVLVLNHPVPAPQPGSEHEWIAEAQAHFSGEVLLANDLLKVQA